MLWPYTGDSEDRGWEEEGVGAEGEVGPSVMASTYNLKTCRKGRRNTSSRSPSATQKM